MPKQTYNHPSLNGPPTADEEALQAPTIDPVLALSNAATFGPFTALKMLGQQGLFDMAERGANEGYKRISQWFQPAGAAIPQDVIDYGHNLRDYARYRARDISGSPKSGIIDNRPTFDKSGKMISWAEQARLDKEPIKPASNVRWTPITRMLEKLMNKIPEDIE